eukprot:g5618.t1
MPSSRFYQARVFRSALSKTAQQDTSEVRVGGFIEPQEHPPGSSENADSKEVARAEKDFQGRGVAPISSVESSAAGGVGEISSVDNPPHRRCPAGTDTAQQRDSNTNTNTTSTSTQPSTPKDAAVTSTGCVCGLENNPDQQQSRGLTVVSTHAETGAQRRGPTDAPTSTNGSKLKALHQHQHQQQSRKRGSKKWRPKSHQKQQRRGHGNMENARTPTATTSASKSRGDGGSSPSGVKHIPGCHGEQEDDEDRTGPSSGLKRLDFHELSPSTSADCEERSPLPETSTRRQRGDSIDSLCSSPLEILAEADGCGAKESVNEGPGVVSKAEPVAPVVASAPGGATSADSKAKQQQQRQPQQIKQKAPKKRKDASAVLPVQHRQPEGGNKTSDATNTLLLETVDVAGGTAQWAADNSRGGEFTKMLETVKRNSGAVSMDTRVVLGKGTGQGGRARMEKLHVDIRASTPAQARVARALLSTHLKSRAELLRLERSRRSMESSLSAFEWEVAQGLRTQFATRPEWIGLLVGKGGARIRDVRKATGCSVEIIGGGTTGNGGGGGGGGGRGGVGGRGFPSSDGSSGGRGGGHDGGRGSTPKHLLSSAVCKVVISGPDAESVEKAREQMELEEAWFPVDQHQAEVLGRLPRTKLVDLRQQSGCTVVDLHAQGWPQQHHHQQQQQEQQDAPVKAAAGPAIRVIGPSAAVDSARLLLPVVLEYMNREREMREGDTAVRERLQSLQASYGRPGIARSTGGAAAGGRGGRGKGGGVGRGVGGGRGGGEGV